ncbi:hypothetical protein OEZ86_003569 [Tetradesmus obliquus]|uniref:Uncharacterized protein n=3 Tax=Tetradesmus obliquus TaxID=3088 RepID=A0ABY8U324_TETOB|nr:hypothetical protein OEZ85_001571 [Tetradesmus obliquus]WIA35083.1 hypothetical protein OEZ86_003569 [Tetradesmus obliquus]|eukprot:jgi/Sobl393_1/17586/SZX62112.1
MGETAETCSINMNKVIKLNVGGVPYATSLATLTCVPSSYFSALFSGRWEQQVMQNGEVFLDRDGEVFKFVLQYLRARASCSDAVCLPADEATRGQLRSEARYFGLPCLEGLLEAPNGSFNDVYMQQSSALDRYIAEQPFQAVKQLVFDILLGHKALQSAWNPGLEQGTIMVSLMNAPLIRFSFSVNIFSDHVKLAEDKNRFKVVLPDQLLESVFCGYYEIYMYDFASKDEVGALNKCLYNLGTRAVLLRMLQEQALFEVRMVYDKRPRSNGSADYELVLEFHRRAPPASPRLSAPC